MLAILIIISLKNQFYDMMTFTMKVMWNGAFRYETDEINAYTFRFDSGSPNPNDLIMPTQGFPASCPAFGTPNEVLSLLILL